MSGARRRKRDQFLEAKRKKLEEDPYRWPCCQCYWDERTPNAKNCFNYGESTQCFKCSRAKPSPYSSNNEHIRWYCSTCSNDEYNLSMMYLS